MFSWRLIVLLLIGYALPATAQTAPASALGVPVDSITHHRFTAGGKQQSFTATSGTLPLVDGKGERQASMFYIAYTRDDAPREARPLTFVFNGGPGASSAYLHLGALGPRIIPFAAGGGLPASPAHMVDNPDTWLDFTDLIFVDPIGTGYSRPVASSDDAAKRFWGVREDLQALAAFINLYLTRNNRMASPKFLVGESYGGFRAARLPELLGEERGVAVSGSFIISPVLEFSLQANDEFIPLTDALRLPSYAAVNLSRSKKVAPAMLADAERFALGPYLTALVGAPHDPATMRPIIAEVARLTGLSEATVARYEGRVPVGVFAKEAKRAESQILSRYDGTISGPDPHPASGSANSDPLFDGLRSTLTAGMAEYMTGTLDVHTDLPYRVTNGEVARQWNWRSGIGGSGGYAGAADSLREALAANPQLRVVIAHGMTDLVTPYLISRYVIDHLPRSLTDGRVTLELLAGGHMMYLRDDSRARLHEAAARLYPAPQL
jgi:carboxypeptidase C (cathepsin A)